MPLDTSLLMGDPFSPQHCQIRQGKRSAAIGVVVGVVDRWLTSHGHAGPSACLVVGVSDIALWCGLRGEPIQVVIATSNEPSNRIINLSEPIPRIIGVVGGR